MDAYNQHYLGRVQPICLMEAQMSTEAFMGYLRGNIIKYCTRLGKKDDIKKETAKILQYAQWLNQVATGKSVDVSK